MSAVALPLDAVAPAAAVVRGLAASEARRLLRHPVMIAGFALWLLAMTESLVRAELTFVQASELVGITLAFFPGIPALVAAHMVATRDRRARTLDLLASTPGRSEERVRALVLAAVAPAALALALNTAAFALLLWRDEFAVTPSVWHLVQGPSLVLGACLLGVMIGVWAPTPAAPVLATIAMVGFHLAVAEKDPAQLFAPMMSWTDWGPYDGSVWVGWHPGSPFGHIVYVLGLCGMAACAAVLRVAERRRTVVVLGLLAVAVTALGAVLQVP